MKNDAQKLMDFIDASPSMYHAAENAAEYLRQRGFTELKESQPFEMEAGGKYFVNKNSSAIIAWQNGTNPRAGFRIIGSHIDSPAFKIKPHPEMIASDCYIKLNTEMYGGAIVSTWLDRPLSAAGRVFVKGADAFSPKQILVDTGEPLLVIPNAAIHMNREVNDGYKYSLQKETLPLFSCRTSAAEKDKPNKNAFMELIAKKAGVGLEDILAADLFLNAAEPSTFLGLRKEFFLAGKIDNLGMAFASLEAMESAGKNEHGQMICLFNNEEVGSSSAAGAGSSFFADTLKRIALWYAREEAKTQKAHTDGFELFEQLLAKSFLISADQAHATHPNFPEKNDVTNFPVINGGPVVKSAASMSYTSEGHTVAVFKQLCKEADVPCQDFVNNSDMRGGSTIGPITMTNLHIKSVDIGNPVLGMHSVREVGGTYDQEAIVKVFTRFFK